jgi:hypothetical protein
MASCGYLNHINTTFLFAGKSAVEDEDEELARAVAASLEENKGAGGSDASDDKPNPEEENEPSLSVKLEYPPLPEEPKGSRDLLCRVAIRLPDGRRIQRNFLHTDPIKVTLLKPLLT